MEIRRWHCYIIVNCVLILYLEAKTFSLNKAIAAESQQIERFETTQPPKLTAPPTKRYSLLERLKSKTRVKDLLKTDYTGGKISPLKYRKTFQIKSPLRPKRLKLSQQARYKRKNKSAKREINGNEKLKQKYIPLLKSLSLLFDNLLNSDTSESHEVKTKKFKRNRFYSDSFEIPCECESKPDSGNTKPEPHEKTATPSPAPTTEIASITENPSVAEASPTATNHFTARDFGTFRQHKDIPVLLPRNTTSTRRNHNGFGERSGPTFYRNIERNITGNHGAHEHVTTFGKNYSRATNDETNTNGATRNSTSGFRYSGAGGFRNITRLSEERYSRISQGKHTAEISENQDTDDNSRENRLEIGGDETKSAKPIPESFRGLRGFLPQDEVIIRAEPIQPEKFREESNFSVANNNTSHKRIPDRDGPFTREDQKVRQRNETMMMMGDQIQTASHTNIPKKKSPVIMIFDGYSVTRDKNGENKFSEKSIRIHS